jgi:L-rhamnose-H+ transport protein
MTTHLESILIIAFAALAQTAFVLPIKFFRDWRWEQMWVAQAVTCFLCSLAAACCLPADFWRMAAALPLSHWLVCYALGILWGVGGAAYGLTLSRLGISFAFSFVLGTIILVGALFPFAMHAAGHLAKPWLFGAGIFLGLIGTVASGIARRGDRPDDLMAMPFKVLRYRWAVALALLAGAFSACYGLAFTLRLEAVTAFTVHGISATFAMLVVALPLYLGSATTAIPVGLACARNTKSLGMFLRRQDGFNWLLAFTMGACATGGSLLYGWATSRQNHLPPNISYAVLTILSIIAGNSVAFFTGEWRNRARPAIALLVSSVTLLVVAVWMLQVS